MKKTILIFLILLISTFASADISINIKGNSKFNMKDANMYLSGNWKNTSSDTSSVNSENATVIFSGAGQDTIENSSGKFSKIKVKNPDGIKLKTPIQVRDSLQLEEGNLDNSEHNVVLGDSASLDIGEGDLEQPPEYEGIINVLYSGMTPVITGMELPSIVNNFTVNNSGGVTLDKILTVTNKLNLFKGNLDDSTFSVTLRDTTHVYKKVGTLSDTLIYEGRKNITYTGIAAAITGKELRPHVDHLTIDNPANVTLDKDVSVDSTLRFSQGKLNTGDYILSLSEYTVVTEGNAGDIWGNLQLPPFYVGTDSLNKMGVFIGAGQDTLGEVTILIISGPGSQTIIRGNRETIQRRWIISSDYPPENGRNLRLTWYPDEDNGNDLANAQAWKSTDGEAWEKMGDVQDVTGDRTVDLDVVSFSHWTVDSELPVNFNRVDMALIQRLIARLGSIQGDSAYDANYDMDEDNDIDMVDLRLMMASWGHQEEE